MATGRVILPIPGGLHTDGSSGNASATPEVVVSTASATTNTPKVQAVRLLFDASTDEHWLWIFQLPGDYSSGGTVNIVWGSKGTTNNVIWKAGVEFIDPSSTDLDNTVFNAADAAAAAAVPGTVGHLKETAVTLTMTGATADDACILFIGRDADAAGDTSTSDAFVVAATFEYTTA